MSNNEKNVVKDVKRRWNKDGFLALIIAGILIVVCLFAAEPTVPKEEFDELSSNYEAVKDERDMLRDEVISTRKDKEGAESKVLELSNENKELDKEKYELSKNVKLLEKCLDLFNQDIEAFSNDAQAFPIYINWEINQETNMVWVTPNTLLNYTENTNFVSQSVLVLMDDVGEWRLYDYNTKEELDMMEVHNGLTINGNKATLQSMVILKNNDITDWWEGRYPEW